MAALSPAPSRLQIAISRGGAMRSARLKTALASAPITKPSCTLIVSHASAPLERYQTCFSEPVTADAENQSVIASHWMRASSRSCCHLAWSFAGLVVLMGIACPCLQHFREDVN